MQLEPYLFFKGNCEEALNFYKDVFGGQVEGLSRWKDMPEGTDGPPVTAETADRVMHASFRGPGVAFMASDATPGKTYGEGAMSLCLSTSDAAEAERAFNRLSDGGNVEMPLTDMFWGAKLGMLTDRFGIDWMINSSTGQ